MSLSTHFNRKEFACRCGCGFDTVDSMTLEALESIRQHTRGRAADIQVKGVEPSAVADYVASLGLSVGRYKVFTHVDSRSGLAARWGEN